MTENHAPGSVADIRQGMRVIDSHGTELGIVAELKMGNDETVTGEGQQVPEPNDLITSFARAIWHGTEFPEQAAARLVRLGYLRIDTPRSRDLYVAADQVAAVQSGAVQLNVPGDQLVRAL